MKEKFTFGQIIDGMDNNQEVIPEHMFCDKCCQMLCSDETAARLEMMFSKTGPHYVDVCDCNGE